MMSFKFNPIKTTATKLNKVITLNLGEVLIAGKRVNTKSKVWVKIKRKTTTNALHQKIIRFFFRKLKAVKDKRMIAAKPT